MVRIAGFWFLAGCATVVVYVEGFHLFALWNLVPLVLVGVTLVRQRPSAASLVFAGVTVLSVTLLHVAWMLDWGGTRTGSSTGGLLFVVSPLIALLLGACAWAAAWTVERIISRTWSNTSL